MRRHLVAMLTCLAFFGCDSRGSGVGDSPPKPELEIMQDGSRRLATEVGKIHFRIVRQASTEASSRPALIIGLHGYGADERQIETLVNVEPSVRHTYVALRAPLSLPDRGFGWFPLRASGSGPSFDVDDVIAAATQVGVIAAALGEQFGADPEQIYLLGFSQGATVALTASLVAPRSASAFIGFAGYLPPELGTRLGDTAVQVPTPVLVGHGTRDSAIRDEDTDRTVAMLVNSGRQVELKTFAVPHVVSAAGRREIAQWIDDRAENVPMAEVRPKALTLVGEATEYPGYAIRPLTEAVLMQAVERGAVLGPPDAEITIYKFFDYNCSACRVAHREMPAFLSEHPQIRVVAVDVPIFGDKSMEASAVTFSIDDPASYLSTYKTLLASRGLIGAAQAIAAANANGGEGLTEDQVSHLVQMHRGSMRDNVSAMKSLSVIGTPGFLVSTAGQRRAITGWDPESMSKIVKTLGAKSPPSDQK